jgi:hypothetical protein
MEAPWLEGYAGRGRCIGGDLLRTAEGSGCARESGGMGVHRQEPQRRKLRTQLGMGRRYVPAGYQACMSGTVSRNRAEKSSCLKYGSFELHWECYWRKGVLKHNIVLIL